VNSKDMFLPGIQRSRWLYEREVPDRTLLAFADHGSVGELMAAGGGDAEETIPQFAKAGSDYDKLATDLQRQAAESFVKDWNEMLASIASKSTAFKAAG